MQDPCSLNTFEPWMLIYVASWWFQIRLFLRWWSTLTFVSLGPVWLTHGSVHGPWIDFKSILEEYLVPDPHPTLKLQVNSTYPWNILHVLRAPSGSSRHFSETSRGPQFDFPIPNPVWRGSGSSNKKTHVYTIHYNYIHDFEVYRNAENSFCIGNGLRVKHIGTDELITAIERVNPG